MTECSQNARQILRKSEKLTKSYTERNGVANLLITILRMDRSEKSANLRRLCDTVANM